jgi:hypothetical protein
VPVLRILIVHCRDVLVVSWFVLLLRCRKNRLLRSYLLIPFFRLFYVSESCVVPVRNLFALSYALLPAQTTPSLNSDHHQPISVLFLASLPPTQ